MNVNDAYKQLRYIAYSNIAFDKAISGQHFYVFQIFRHKLHRTEEERLRVLNLVIKDLNSAWEILLRKFYESEEERLAVFNALVENPRFALYILEKKLYKNEKEESIIYNSIKKHL